MYSMIQYSTVRYSSVQYNIVRNSKLPRDSHEGQISLWGNWTQSHQYGSAPLLSQKYMDCQNSYCFLYSEENK